MTQAVIGREAGSGPDQETLVWTTAQYAACGAEQSDDVPVATWNSPCWIWLLRHPRGADGRRHRA